MPLIAASPPDDEPPPEPSLKGWLGRSPEVWQASPADGPIPVWLGRAAHPADAWLTSPATVVELVRPVVTQTAVGHRLGAPRREPSA